MNKFQHIENLRLHSIYILFSDTLEVEVNITILIKVEYHGW